MVIEDVILELRELRADLRGVRQILDQLLLALVGERPPGLAALLRDAPPSEEEPETDEQKQEREDLEAFKKAFHQMTGETMGVSDG